MEVIVIGGGPAGMVAAISAKEHGNKVTLLEKMDRLGKKMAITGKGRCNITSSLPTMDKFIENIPGNGRFLYSAFQNFTNKDILKLIDIPTKNERGNRVFPVSDRATDVVQALERKLDGVKVLTNVEVKEILTRDEKVYGVKTNKGEFGADAVILATGGLSYPVTGSTGDGYRMAEQLGHKITDLKPSLVAMTAEGESLKICQDAQGLTLKNVVINIFENNKKIYDDFGEMLFAHFGISGPIVLSASAHLVRTKMRKPKAVIDLKPALSEEKIK